jgi:hypothetical protein
MAVVAVGGQARKVGKTSVVCGLIAALPERQWTAVKITDHAHGLASGQEFAITEERDPSGATDTARFLQAGAPRALLVSSPGGHLADAMPELRRALQGAENVILESNSVMRFLRPDVYLAVLDSATADFKDSAREFIAMASALVVCGEPAGAPALEGMAGKPVFTVRPPQYVTRELVEFVHGALGCSADSHRF